MGIHPQLPGVHRGPTPIPRHIRSTVIFLLTGLFLFSWGLCFAAEKPVDSDKAYDEFDAKMQALFSADETLYSEKRIEEAISQTQWFLNKYPLKPPDTSSPRKTLKTFLRTMKGTHNLLMMAHQKNLKGPGLFASEPVLQLRKFAEALFPRSVWCLNLSEVPDAYKQAEGWEAAFTLKEILDRIELPPFDQIPDAQELNRWRLPNTNIVIARVEEDPRKGEYLFTSETVGRTDGFYHIVKDLPYNKDKYVSPGFLDFYRSTPGRLLPPRWSRWLPSWTNAMYHGQTIWQWAAMAVFLLLAFVANWPISLWWRRKAVRLLPMMRSWGWAIFKDKVLLFPSG